MHEVFHLLVVASGTLSILPGETLAFAVSDEDVQQLLTEFSSIETKINLYGGARSLRAASN